MHACNEIWIDSEEGLQRCREPAASSCDDDILIDVKTAAQFLHETVSGLECPARAGVGPKFISMDPLRYHPDDLLKYAKERAASASQRNLKPSTAVTVGYPATRSPQ